ncbi:MAG: hypothetical protein HY046_02730, partial [Acidobacteria bacterium]|nr:hypothetical protein [Acidobacteriota bacterium]
MNGKHAFLKFAIPVLLLSLAVALFGQEKGQSGKKDSFEDITRTAGIQFVHNNGAFGKKYLPETLGPGCAFID